LDFDGPDSIWSPFSAWLADQFSIALKASGSPVTVIDRSQLEPYEPIPDDYGTGPAKFNVAHQLGADTIIDGTYRPTQDGVGVTLNAYPVVCFGDDTTSVLLSPITTVNGKIPFTEEIGSKVYLPLDALWPKNKQFHSGQGGVGDVSCSYCPKPALSAEAREKKIGGIVVVEAMITPEGRAIHTKVVMSRGSELDEQAVEVVKTWKFKPAADGDGKPVPVSALLEVAFRSN